MLLTATLLWAQEVAVGAIPTPVVVAIVGFLTAAVGILGTLQYVRSKPTGPAADALLERAEGAWQEKVGSMLTRLADTIAEGNAVHRDELHAIGAAMRDSTTAMRACVDEIKAQRVDFTAYSTEGRRAIGQVAQLHDILVKPAKSTRRRGR